jgi:hypothetical protein
MYIQEVEGLDDDGKKMDRILRGKPSKEKENDHEDVKDQVVHNTRISIHRTYVSIRTRISITIRWYTTQYTRDGEGDIEQSTREREREKERKKEREKEDHKDVKDEIVSMHEREKREGGGWRGGRESERGGCACVVVCVHIHAYLCLYIVIICIYIYNIHNMYYVHMYMYISIRQHTHTYINPQEEQKPAEEKS